jgi:hypothetical protein
MKRYTSFLAGLIGLIMMGLPGIASANMTVPQSQNLNPIVYQETAPQQPHLTLAYWHHPWACRNRHFRWHHPNMCR